MNRSTQFFAALFLYSPVVLANTTVFATGMSEPEGIVQLSNGNFLVNDAAGYLWSVPSAGGPATLFDNFSSADSLGEVLLPANYGTQAGQLFVTLGSLASTVNTVTGATSGGGQPADAPIWGTPVIAPAGFGTIGGDLLITNADTGSTVGHLYKEAPGFSGSAPVFATTPTATWGAAFAPAGFGGVAGDLIVSSGFGDTLYTVTSSGVSTLFATLAATDLRQITFAPTTFDLFGGDLFVSATNGDIYVVNGSGNTVATLTAASLGISDPSFSPRTVLFLDNQHALINDEANGQTYELSVGPTVPEPAPIAALALGFLLLAARRRQRAA